MPVIKVNELSEYLELINTNKCLVYIDFESKYLKLFKCYPSIYILHIYSKEVIELEGISQEFILYDHGVKIEQFECCSESEVIQKINYFFPNSIYDSTDAFLSLLNYKTEQIVSSALIETDQVLKSVRITTDNLVKALSLESDKISSLSNTQSYIITEPDIPIEPELTMDPEFELESPDELIINTKSETNSSYINCVIS